MIKDLEDTREQAMHLCGGRDFQERTAVSAKALRWGWPYLVVEQEGQLKKSRESPEKAEKGIQSRMWEPTVRYKGLVGPC